MQRAGGRRKALHRQVRKYVAVFLPFLPRCRMDLDLGASKMHDRFKGSSESPSPSRPLELTPRATQIIALAAQRAKELGQERVGAEHLLLALSEETESVAARALRELDVADTLPRRLLEIFQEPGYNTTTRRLADSEGFLGHVETDGRGNDVFIDSEGNPAPWPGERSVNG